ncbi:MULTISPECIES: AAA family ATPase [unclassified Bradyrhizobium]
MWQNDLRLVSSQSRRPAWLANAFNRIIHSESWKVIGSLRGANPWVSPADISFFLKAFGVSEFAEPVAPEAFALPGRPALEAFFREYVIEPSADPDRYQALRGQLPNGILLYGSPGSGKTHAVDTLVAALRRPTFRLDLGEVGSPSTIRRRSRCGRRSNKPSAAPRVIPARSVEPPASCAAKSRIGCCRQ